MSLNVSQKLEQQRHMLLGIGWSVCILGLLLCGFLILSSYTLKPVPSTNLIDWILPVFPLLILIAFLIAAQRAKRILAGYKIHSDCTCPICGGQAKGLQQCCERFPESWSKVDLARYWEDRSTNRLMAISVKRGDPPQALAWWIRYQVETISGLLVLAGISMLAIGIWLWFKPALFTSPIGLLGVIPAYLIFMAIFVWSSGKQEYSSSGLCPACGHAVPPNFTEGSCNECGEFIDKKSKKYVTPSKYKLFMNLAIWLPLLFIWTWVLIPTTGTGAVVLGIVSNSTLIEMASERNVMVNDEVWDELATRTLTAKERNQLFDVALQERRKISYFGKHNELGAWLQAEIDAGNLSAEEFRRIWVDSWIPELVVPAQATAGDPFTVILQGERREDFQPNSIGTVILFDGFTIDDGPVVGRETNTLWALDADSDKKGEFRHFKAPLSIDTPGTYTLRASYWLMDRPFGKLDDPVERDAEGRPIRPLHSTWMIPLTIEQEIEIDAPKP